MNSSGLSDRVAYELMEAVSRFWSRVHRPEDANECWPWLGGTNDDGYGIFHFGSQKVYVHRFSIIATHGARLPKRVLACHRCDYRICTNPEHIFLGTARDNGHDRSVKYRLRRMYQKSEIRPLSAPAFSVDARRERDLLIAELADNGYSRRFLAREFAMPLSTVKGIVSRARDYAAA